MPSKTEEYLALAQRTANGLTRYWESWTDYLTTASRLYKYPFADQLMIYAQRPDATACADFDIWNTRMNRYVRRGAKGIALLDESSGFPRLHYVFDVSDTGVRRNSRDPEVWQFNDDLKQPVSEMLAATYGISGERVSQQLADVAGKLVADYWDNNGGDIRAIVDGSLLMDYDEAGVEMQFKSAAAISVTYTLLERCGFEPAGWFDKEDFRAIHEFSTPDSVYALGAAVSDMSREVLRNIERTVKTTIRRRNDLKNNTVFLSGPLRDCDYKSGFSNVDDELDFLRRICEIEEHFSVKIKIPDVIMTKDYKQVRYLSDLLRGERVKRNADEIKCTAIAGDGFRNRMKETGDAIEDLVNVGPSRVTIFGSDFDIQIVRELKNTQIMQIDKVKALLNILDNGEEFPLKLKLVTKEYYESLPSEELLSQLDKLNMPE